MCKQINNKDDCRVLGREGWMGSPFEGESGLNVKEEIILQSSRSQELEAQREVTVKVVR